MRTSIVFNFVAVEAGHGSKKNKWFGTTSLEKSFVFVDTLLFGRKDINNPMFKYIEIYIFGEQIRTERNLSQQS